MIADTIELNASNQLQMDWFSHQSNGYMIYKTSVFLISQINHSIKVRAAGLDRLYSSCIPTKTWWVLGAYYVWPSIQVGPFQAVLETGIGSALAGGNYCPFYGLESKGQFFSMGYQLAGLYYGENESEFRLTLKIPVSERMFLFHRYEYERYFFNKLRFIGTGIELTF